MRVGMLWFDDNKSRNLIEKVEKAAQHYKDKYNLWPTVCYVHPSMLAQHYSDNGVPVGLAELDERPVVAMKASNTVLPHHLWIGRSDDTPSRGDIEDNSPARQHPEGY